MGRLTVNDLNEVCYDPWELCGMDVFCKKDCYKEGGCRNGCHIIKMYRKLAEYEDFEEIFRSKMTDSTCEFLKEKEEFARWLDRNRWIAKKCDEYARAEEQGKLLKLPCAVGDTVYTNCSMQGWYFRKENQPYAAKVVFVGINGVDNYINVDFGNGHMLQFKFSDIGKTVFLTKEEAEKCQEVSE